MTTTALAHQPWCDTASHAIDLADDPSVPCYGPPLGPDGSGVEGWWRPDGFALMAPGLPTGGVEIPRGAVPQVLALLQQAAADRP